MTPDPIYKEFTMLKDKLTVVAQVTRKAGPWVQLAGASIVIADYILLKKNK